MASPALVVGGLAVAGWGLWRLIFGGKGSTPAPDDNDDDVDPPVNDLAGVCLDGDAIKAGWTTAKVQNSLRTLGIEGPSGPLEVDDDCGPETKSAISTFQSTHSIKPKGYVDIITATAIDAALAAKSKSEGDDSEDGWGGGDPGAWADGCTKGSQDAIESIKAGTSVNDNFFSGKSIDWGNGYRACFMKTLGDNGYEIDENGDISPAEGKSNNDGWVTWMGDAI